MKQLYLSSIALAAWFGVLMYANQFTQDMGSIATAVFLGVPMTGVFFHCLFLAGEVQSVQKKARSGHQQEAEEN